MFYNLKHVNLTVTRFCCATTASTATSFSLVSSSHPTTCTTAYLQHLAATPTTVRQRLYKTLTMVPHLRLCSQASLLTNSVETIFNNPHNRQWYVHSLEATSNLDLTSTSANKLQRMQPTYSLSQSHQHSWYLAPGHPQ